MSGLKDKAEVETLQDQSLNMLQHQVSTNLTRSNTRYARYPLPPSLSSHLLSLTQHCRLILAVSNLRNISSSTIEKIYFEKTIGATPMKKLLCDMFKN